MTTSRNLILATAMGYGPQVVRPFVESLRHHYDGEVGFLVTSRGADAASLVAYLRSRAITPYFFDTALWMVTDIQVGRYVRYYEILSGQPGTWDRVLLTDVSDVVFQGHPFAAAPEGELLAFLEHSARCIGDCPTNSMWIKDIFGDAGLAKVRNRPISCSGTTIGSQTAIQTYLEKLLSHAKPQQMMALQGKRGHDQGIHNYLFHTGALNGATLVENGVFVHTLGYVPAGEVAIGNDGIRSAAGTLCPIVHQYNYLPAAANWVGRAWPAK